MITSVYYSDLTYERYGSLEEAAEAEAKYLSDKIAKFNLYNYSNIVTKLSDIDNTGDYYTQYLHILYAYFKYLRNTTVLDTDANSDQYLKYCYAHQHYLRFINYFDSLEVVAFASIRDEDVISDILNILNAIIPGLTRYQLSQWLTGADSIMILTTGSTDDLVILRNVDSLVMELGKDIVKLPDHFNHYCSVQASNSDIDSTRKEGDCDESE